MPQQRWKDLQYQFVIERDDEIGAGRKQMRLTVRQSMAARDVERRRQALRRVGAPGVVCLDILYDRQGMHWARLAVRVGALELAQQAVAALDRGIHRGLRGFLAGK